MTPEQKKDLRKNDLTWVSTVVASAQLKDWHGTITIKMEGGEIRLLRTEETHLPPSRRGESTPPA